ncbi:MAG TPA: hypothetical protein VED41_03565, partial [Solirubrobacteraceae bacterium]|nr:hypothetical protein [Solirubrobacteraceae bacterium]
ASITLDLPEGRFDAIRTMAMKSPDRRFRIEVMGSLRVVTSLAPEPMRSQARAVLDQLASSNDPIVAADARWSLETPVDSKAVKSLFELRFQ